MKIIDIKTTKLFYETKILLKDGLGFINGRDALFVEICTDEGIKGVGECAAFWIKETVETLIHEEFKPILIGEDPLQIEALWDKMYRASFRHGRRGISIIAISGIDIALWDILGKVSKMPVYKLLGGAKKKVKVYASAGYISEGKTKHDLAEEMKTYKDMGFDSMKMKVGNIDYKEDIERVMLVREVVGNDVNLMLDANNAWDTNTALKMVKELEKYHPYFLEEPVSTDNIEGSRIVAASTIIPIAGYETEYTRFGYRELIIRKAIDIAQPDVTWSGGFTEAKKIADLASTFNLSCIPHTYGGAIGLLAGLHFAAAIQNVLFFEWGMDDNPLRNDLLVDPLEVKNGFITVTEKPGLGIELDLEKLKKYVVD